MPPPVSVLIPCRNEAAFIGRCLDSVLASDYPGDLLEVLVADGRSTDGTRTILETYAERDTRVRWLDNAAGITPAGLNRAIEAARGTILVRLDAHACIARDYLSRAVAHLEHSGADNVGGLMRTIARDPGPFSEPIRVALEHPFGVGNSHFRTGAAGPRWVDTVFGGCWHRELFTRLGGFNERLVRGQDLEFNIRLRRAGGRILLAPDLHSDYYARTAPGSFLKHTWTNGVWAILPFAYSDVVPVRWRHLVPMAFCGALVGLPLAGLWARPLWWLGIFLASSYAAADLVASVHAAVRERNPRILPLLPLVFLGLHVAYGMGSWWGLARLAVLKYRSAGTPLGVAEGNL